MIEDAVPPTGISENGSCPEALRSMSGTTGKRGKSSVLNQYHDTMLDGNTLVKKVKGKLVKMGSAECALQSVSNRQLPHLPSHHLGLIYKQDEKGPDYHRNTIYKGKVCKRPPCVDALAR